MIAVGLLYTAGFSSLDTLQEKEQLENAERVFTAVADSFDELQENQAPKRAGSLDLDIGATLLVTNESQLNVTVNGPDWETSIRIRSLAYQVDDTSIAYESGAVFRTDKGNTAMLVQPDVQCASSTRTAIISVVRLTNPQDRGVGSGTATITGLQRSSTLLFPNQRTGAPITGIENVTINVSSPREDGWNRYFGDSDTDWTDSNGDGIYACENVDRVFVRETVIEVRLVR